MANGLGVNMGTRYATSYSGHSDNSGWNGWLYPVLFIVLPIVASLMVLALIGCNIYEYYKKKRRLEQYQYYSDNMCPKLGTDSEKPIEVSPELVVGTGGYNEVQYTYNTLYGNYVPNEDNRAPVRPLSGWIAPQM